MTTFGIGIRQKTVKEICELLISPGIDSSTNQQRNRELVIVYLEMFSDEIYTYLDTVTSAKSPQNKVSLLSVINKANLNTLGI